MDEGVQAFSASAGTGLTIALIISATLAVSVSLRPVARRLISRLADRSRNGLSHRWRPRVRRLETEGDETAEVRRQQRIDAAASMTARIVAILLWVAAIIAVLHQLEIDVTLALGGAGFLGAGLAIGGQHTVNDFLTGLHILLEDRCGEGDQLRIRLDDNDVYGTVAWMGAFSIRLESDLATIHLANRELSRVVNLSQRGVTEEVRIPIAASRETPTTMALETGLRAAYRATSGYDSSADGLVVDGVRRNTADLAVSVRTLRRLSETQVAELAATDLGNG